MKRAISLILTLVLCLGLCACGDNADNAPVESTSPEETTEPAPVSYWETDYYVDSFGDLTDEPYMFAVVDGTFSNTATMEADVQVVIYYSHTSKGNAFSFRLLEYGERKATFSTYDDINIQIKDSWGVSDKWKLYGSAPNGDIYDTDTYISDQIKYDLTTSKIDVPAIITIGSSTYKFTIPLEGFEVTYEEYETMRK